MSKAASVRDILQERRVLLVGASTGATSPQTFNAAITRSLVHADLDELVLVGRNPGHFGTLSILASLDEVGPKPPRTAVVAVPRQELLESVKHCANLGVTTAIVITGTLTDQDRHGLRDLTKSGMRIWGPNCIGFLSVLHGLTALASDWRPDSSPKPYGWSIIVQSGGAALSLAVLAARTPVAVRQLFTTGDEVDIASEEILEYLVDEDGVEGCLVFLEEPRQPNRFRRAVAAMRAASKPVVIVKVGRTPQASAMAFSHSGVTVGGWDEFAAAAAASGAVVCDSYAVAMDTAAVLAATRQRRPPRRLAIVSSSGGTAGLACDLMPGTALELARVSEITQHRLSAACGGAHVIPNPFDAINAGGIKPGTPAYLEAIEGDDGIDVVTLLHVSSRGATEVGFALEAAALKNEHVVVATWPAVPQAVGSRLLQNGIPVFDDVEAMMRALSHAVVWHESGRGDSPIRDAVLTSSASLEALTYVEGVDMLTDAGLPLPRSTLMRSSVVTGDASPALELRFPVVVKGAGVRGHKRAQGAVRVGVRDKGALHVAASEMLPLLGTLVVEEQVEGDAEVMIAARESAYGQVLCFGPGGVYADYALQSGGMVYVAEPFSEMIVRAALERSPLSGVLRVGGSPGNLEAVASIGIVLAGLLRTQHVHEIETNPVVLTANGPIVVDVKIAQAKRGDIPNGNQQ